MIYFVVPNLIFQKKAVNMNIIELEDVYAKITKVCFQLFFKKKLRSEKVLPM